jgi:hypothetical protein
VNLFSFWVERHPRKKMKFEFKTFAANADDWMPSLLAWENETMDEMRSLDAAPELEPIDEPKTPQQIEMSKLIFNHTAVTGYFPPAAALEKLSVLAATRSEIIAGLTVAIGDGGALGTRKTKLQDFFEHDGATSVILLDRENTAREAAAAAQRAATAKRLADEKAAVEKLRKEAAERESALAQARGNWISDVRRHFNDNDHGKAWMLANPPKIEWNLDDAFLDRLAQEQKAVQKAEEERRAFEELKTSGALDPAIRYLEKELHGGSGWISFVISQGAGLGIPEDHIRKAIRVMKVTESTLGGEPCWSMLPKDYVSPIAPDDSQAAGK